MDLFIEAMKSIAEEVEEDPQMVLDAPHSTRVSRLDETAAARKPVLTLEARRVTAGRIQRHMTNAHDKKVRSQAEPCVLSALCG